MARVFGLEALVGVSYGYMARDSKVARCRSIGPLGAHISHMSCRPPSHVHTWKYEFSHMSCRPPSHVHTWKYEFNLCI